MTKIQTFVLFKFWTEKVCYTRSFHFPSPHGLNDQQKSWWGW